MIFDVPYDVLRYIRQHIKKIDSEILDVKVYIVDCHDLNIQDAEWLCKSRKEKMYKYIRERDKKLLFGSELAFLGGIIDMHEIKDDAQLDYFYRLYSRRVDLYGKPYVENEAFKYNISHSGKYAVCAFADKEIGIDIENNINVNLDVAKRFYTKQEYINIISIKSENTQIDTAVKYWVMKESFVKAVGMGLRIPLDSFWFDKVEPGIWRVNHVYNNKQYYIELLSISNKNYKLDICKNIV